MHGNRPRTAHRTVLAAALALIVAVSGACAVPAPTAGDRVPSAGSVPVAAHQDVAYGAHPKHHGDIHLPTAGGNRGVIITVHGGGFIGGHRGEVPALFGPVLAQTRRGYAIFNISYRLQGQGYNPFPNAVNDVATAVKWVRTHGARHGLNPRTVIVAGHSAGGTLAALVGTTSNGRGPAELGVTAKVDGWLSIAGIYDFTQSSGPTADLANLLWVTDPAKRPAASVVHHLDRNDPPGYIVHGDHDVVVPIAQAHWLLGAAANQGITGRLYYDLVDTGSTSCRGHEPQCGMNASTLNYWVDQVTDRKL